MVSPSKASCAPAAAVDVGQRAGVTEGKGIAVPAHRVHRITQAVPPYLQRAELGNAILDVVERVQEDVQLPVPASHALLFEARPVHTLVEPAANAKPRRIARGGIRPGRIGVDPVLERIDRCHVRQRDDHVLEMLETGAPQVVGREVPEWSLQMRRRQEFHRHRRELTGLRSGMPLPDERQALRGEGMEGVPSLVHERHDVVHEPDGVHEDERPPAPVERVAIAPRCLPRTAVEVEQAFVDHDPELGTERRIDPVEHRPRPAREFGTVTERAQRLRAIQVDGHVPRTQRGQLQHLATVLHEPRHRPASRDAPPHRGSARSRPASSRTAAWP